VIETVLNLIINYLPILVGAVFVFSAFFRYPKPPAKWYMRLFFGGMGVCLLYASIHRLVISK
jgi:hypothetical protein